MFAAGYDLSTPEAVDETLAEFDEVVGVEHLDCVHLNDSKHECGTNKDEHALIGEGLIGEEGMRAFINHDAITTTCRSSWRRPPRTARASRGTSSGCANSAPTEALRPRSLRATRLRGLCAVLRRLPRTTRRGMWTDSREALSDLQLGECERVLDVGCGTGELTRVLREETDGTVVGLDADTDLLAAAGDPTVCGDATQLPSTTTASIWSCARRCSSTSPTPRSQSGSSPASPPTGWLPSSRQRCGRR